MKVDFRREPPSRAVLEVEVPAEEVSREIGAAAARLARRVRVPGFRSGKAPRSVLERYIGRDELYGEALEALVASAYRRALVEAGVTPVGRPDFEVPQLEETQPLRFVARVDVSPEVDPGRYDQVKVPFDPPAVSDADVDAAVEELRVRHSRLASVSGASAADGDFVLIRPTEVDGIERLQPGREVLIEIGGTLFPAEVGDALRGAVAGSQVTVTVGEGGRLVASVVDVRRRELPEAGDAFAKQTGGASTMEELRARIRARVEADALAGAHDLHQEQVLTSVLGGASVEIPVTLVEGEIESLLADMGESLQKRGYTLERYLEAAGKDLAAAREELRPRAEHRLKLRLVLDEIARREGLEPTPEEIADEEEKVAADLKQDPERIREWLGEGGRRAAMIAVLRRRKTVASLVSRSQ